MDKKLNRTALFTAIVSMMFAMSLSMITYYYGFENGMIEQKNVHKADIEIMQIEIHQRMNEKYGEPETLDELSKRNYVIHGETW